MIVVAMVAVVAGLYLFPEQTVAKEITLQAQEFGFNDSSGGPTITVKVGDTVRITVKNIAMAGHVFGGR